jgi:hypothetical protein
LYLSCVCGERDRGKRREKESERASNPLPLSRDCFL